MPADENVAIMQRAYDAFNAGDIDTLTELFDENVVWHQPGRSSMSDDHGGRDATLAFFGQIGQETDGRRSGLSDGEEVQHEEREVEVGMRFRRFALVWLVALPLFLGAGLTDAEDADASCTYNVGSGQYHSFSFSSHWSDFGGYGSWNFPPGQSKCWYAHGWDAGWFAPPDCWVECDFWPEEIDIHAHGWIYICAYPTSEGAQWVYRAHEAYDSTPAYAQGDYGYPPGCTGPLGSSDPSSPAPPSSPTPAIPLSRSTARAGKPTPSRPRPIGTDASFFTGKATSPKVQSITFHLRRPGGRAIASLCMPPVDVAHEDLSLARRTGVKKLYVGIVEHGKECHDPKVARREQARRPRADTRFAPFCQGTGGRVVRTFRYPDDFTESKRPSCVAKAG